MNSSRWKRMFSQTSPQSSLRAKARLLPIQSSLVSTWQGEWSSESASGTSRGRVHPDGLLEQVLLHQTPPSENTLHIQPREILETARSKCSIGAMVASFIKQFVAETHLFLRGIKLRLRSNQAAVASYLRLNAQQLEQVNLRQAWANWRSIPKALSGNVPQRPLRVLDLCCGIGQSTAVLAHYLPTGSAILGVDVNPAFVERARTAEYRSRSGAPADVQFVAGSVLETWKDASGRELPGNSVDAVHCIGALGEHFNYADRTRVASEAWRVLRRDGVAIVDARGRKGREKTQRIFSRAGFVHKTSVRSCGLDRNSLEVFVKI
jgi:SAM-dependent methyltransferase